jgi:uncharacterized protein YjdB
VIAPVLTSIAITPTTINLSAGGTATFTATGTYTDATTGDVTGAVNWTSSNTTVATIDRNGATSACNTGTTNISAANGVTSNVATLTCP